MSQSSQWRFPARDLESIGGLWEKLKSSPPAGRAQQPHSHGNWARTSGTCVQPKVGYVFHVPGNAHVYCTHSLLWPQQPWRRSGVTCLAHGGPETCRKVAGGGMDVALPSPLSTGRTSQIDTCKSLIRSFLFHSSFIHPFIQPKNIC